MANEAILVTRTAHPLSYACADGTAIEKGALVKITGDNTVGTVTSSTSQFIGIAAAEKVANDGVTQIPIYREGRFKLYISGSVSIGNTVGLDDSVNYVKSIMSTTALSGSKIVGTVLESVTTGQTALVDVFITPLGSQ